MSISSVLLQTFRPVSYAKKELAKAIVADPLTKRAQIARALETVSNSFDFKGAGAVALRSQDRLERFAAGLPAVPGDAWLKLEPHMQAKKIVQAIRNLEVDLKGQLKTARAQAADAGSINAHRATDLSAAVATLRDIYQPRMK
ncbi:hypothetical protein ICJ04_15245 [Stenotrophomonas sp. 169]|uniref:hypothetical protein n=1 Tax=Stenotrophomonas sp. 169 TaxID=2770322 RepID=UPI00166284A8|nr:hypothetical protein [Stenotrophomonas sp. 169]QNR96826.1 hypothetical protein ICJ04_15245 [Stenotrophomonas sp. 169]